MAILNQTYGVQFPFKESLEGNYLRLTKEVSDEVRTNLLHLILTRKGSRYYLPDFGTRIYEFIFEPMDGTSFEAIKEDITNAVEKYIPNLTINEITITPYLDDLDAQGDLNTEKLGIGGIYRIPGRGVEEYTAKLRIDYTIRNKHYSQQPYNPKDSYT